jgi:hypothetical protein
VTLSLYRDPNKAWCLRDSSYINWVLKKIVRIEKKCDQLRRLSDILQFWG